MVGHDEVPVARVERAGPCVHLELVDAVREVGLEVAHLLGRLERVGSARPRVEGEDLRPEDVAGIRDVSLDERHARVPFPGEEADLPDHRGAGAGRLGGEGDLDLERLAGLDPDRLGRVDVAARVDVETVGAAGGHLDPEATLGVDEGAAVPEVVVDLALLQEGEPAERPAGLALDGPGDDGLGPGRGGEGRERGGDREQGDDAAHSFSSRRSRRHGGMDPPGEPSGCPARCETR